MDYQNALDFIHSLSKFAEKKGHDNIKAILSKLNNPQDELKFVHIAGTNGKGSVAAFVSSILKEHGLKVGTFISPFIERFNERIQIDGVPIEDSDLVSYTERIKEICDLLPHINPLEFEVITAMGFKYFLDKKCDIVVLETGLGGRLDSTNVINNPYTEIICQIGLDHTQILGDTIEEIAYEKAGIIKPDTKVILYPDNTVEVCNVIKNTCEEKNCELIIPDINGIDVLSVSDLGSDVVYKEMNIHIPLVGRHQILNAICAAEGVKSLPYDITDDTIIRGISNTKWPCRFEIFGEKRNIVLDGAHNHPGILSFKNTVNDVFKDKKLIFLLGMLNDKEYKRSFDEVLPLCDKLIITSVPSVRQINADEVFSYAKSIKDDAVYIGDNYDALTEALKHMDDDSVLCIFGSLYLVGNIRRFVHSM